MYSHVIIYTRFLYVSKKILNALQILSFLHFSSCSELRPYVIVCLHTFLSRVGICFSAQEAFALCFIYREKLFNSSGYCFSALTSSVERSGGYIVLGGLYPWIVNISVYSWHIQKWAFYYFWRKGGSTGSFFSMWNLITVLMLSARLLKFLIRMNKAVIQNTCLVSYRSVILHKWIQGRI